MEEDWALGSSTPRQRAPKQGSLGFSVVGFLSGPGEQAQLGVFVSDIVPGGVAHRSVLGRPLPLTWHHYIPLCSANIRPLSSTRLLRSSCLKPTFFDTHQQTHFFPNQIFILKFLCTIVFSLKFMYECIQCGNTLLH